MKATIFLFVIVLGLSLTQTACNGPKVPDANLVLLPVKDDPTVSFRIWFKVGSQNDPAGKEGLAEITASMLTDASTINNSYEQVLDKLYPLAVSYSASSSVEMTVVEGRVHKDNLNEYYPLLMDAILRPAFKQDDLERIRKQVLNYLQNTLRFASDEELGKAVLYNDVFAGTSYGHITSGLIESVKGITLDDIKDFYKKYYTRDNVIIGVGGGYDTQLLNKLQADLGTLPAGAVAEVPVSQPKPISGFNVTIVEKDAASTAISMGFPINLLRGSKDWYTLAIANSWLGEHRNSSSHLFQVIRDARGMNYGDYSYIENFPDGGSLQMPPQNVCRRQQIFEIWIRPVPNETRQFALRAGLRELNKMIDNGLTQEQFELTRNFLKKYVLHYAPTTMERLGYALDDRFYGIQGSHLENFRKMMDEMTLADVNGAIKKYLHYGDMQVAIVTKDAEGLKKALVQDTPSPMKYQSVKSQAVLSEDKEIMKFPVKVEPGKIRIVPVAELFEK